MSWALPFLLMQLFVKARNATEFVATTQGIFLVLSVASLALFLFVVHVAISRFSLMQNKEQRSRALRAHAPRGLSKASR